jgi:oligopeptide/dipeptide ABC transporter ATP-binding protein
MPPILEIQELSIHYPISIGTVRAVEGVSLQLDKGEAVGLVGESGCGKSTLGLSILNLLRPPGRIVSGKILYHGRDVLAMSRRELLQLRGRGIATVFQNPLTSLNPLMRIDEHFLETIRQHEPSVDTVTATARTVRVLESLGIEKARMHDYPHQLSGGMRQRIMIGLGLIMNPDIIIADEPTTSLDVIVEAGFIDLLGRLRREFDLTILLITHNLGLVAEIADRVAVMYGGRIVEIGEAKDIYKTPLHPYTRGLINCVPNIKLEQKHLATMEGSPPGLVEPPPGCRFQARCPEAMDVCARALPALEAHEGRREVACWLHDPAPSPREAVQ